MLSRIFSESRFSLIFAFFCIFFFSLYVRKKRKTFLMLAIGSIIYVALSLTLFFGQKGLNLISLSLLGIIVVCGSYKELIKLEKEGKTVGDLFEFDSFDFILASLLFVIWILLKMILLKL